MIALIELTEWFAFTLASLAVVVWALFAKRMDERISKKKRPQPEEEIVRYDIPVKAKYNGPGRQAFAEEKSEEIGKVTEYYRVPKWNPLKIKEREGFVYMIERRLDKIEEQMLTKWDVAMIVGTIIAAITFVVGTTVALIKYIGKIP